METVIQMSWVYLYKQWVKKKSSFKINVLNKYNHMKKSVNADFL